MIVNLFLFGAVGALLFMAGFEVRRYQHARVEPSAFPYPRSRLVRRVTNAALAMAILLGLAFKPDGRSPAHDLLWYAGCMLLTLFLLLITLRDLRESGVAAVAAHHEFQRQAADQLRDLIEHEHRADTSAARRKPGR